MKRIKTSIVLSERQAAILKNEAGRLQVTTAEVIRRLLDAWAETQSEELQS